MDIDDYTLLILRKFSNSGAIAAQGPGGIDERGHLVNVGTITVLGHLRNDGIVEIGPGGVLVIDGGVE